MRRTRKNRVFPYYIIVAVDETAQRMQILDLNTIQRTEEDGERERQVYEPNIVLHDLKWITVPGPTKAERGRVISWIKNMMGGTFMAETKCMVYNHRAHWTNPLHEEYKRKVFVEWEAAMKAKNSEEIEISDEE